MFRCVCVCEEVADTQVCCCSSVVCVEVVLVLCGPWGRLAGRAHTHTHTHTPGTQQGPCSSYLGGEQSATPSLRASQVLVVVAGKLQGVSALQLLLLLSVCLSLPMCGCL